MNITKKVMWLLTSTSSGIHSVQSTRIENIIGGLMILIGTCSILSPSQTAMRGYLDGRPGAWIITSLLSIIFIICGMKMFNKELTENQIKVFVSPIMLYTIFVIMGYVVRPEAYRFSLLVPIIFVMNAWIIISYTLSDSRK